MTMTILIVCCDDWPVKLVCPISSACKLFSTIYSQINHSNYANYAARNDDYNYMSPKMLTCLSRRIMVEKYK